VFHVEPAGRAGASLQDRGPTALQAAIPRRYRSAIARPLRFGKVVAMEFIALLRFRPSVPAAERDAALMRRAAWQYPDGVKMIAEYWPMSAEYQVITVFAAETIAPIMEIEFEWNDVFDISVSPAISADEGLRVGPEVFGRLPRMQQAG
jgi:hypothetical protein